MSIPVVVGSRLRFRIHWRLVRPRRIEDGFEIGIWGHPALQVAMTPSGLQFTQIDWYTFTISYKRRRLLRPEQGEIEPSRLLLGVASGRLGFVYLGIYLSDWRRMIGLGQLPLEVGRLRAGTVRQEKAAP